MLFRPVALHSDDYDDLSVSVNHQDSEQLDSVLFIHHDIIDDHTMKQLYCYRVRIKTVINAEIKCV